MRKEAIKHPPANARLPPFHNLGFAGKRRILCLAQDGMAQKADLRVARW
jgi:hypothetical protein